MLCLIILERQYTVINLNETIKKLELSTTKLNSDIFMFSIITCIYEIKFIKTNLIYEQFKKIIIEKNFI